MKYLVNTMVQFLMTYEVEADSEDEATDIVNALIGNDELESYEVDQEFMGEMTILARKKQ